MNTKALERKLLEITDDFNNEICTSYPAGSKEPVTENDINEFGRHVYYSMLEFAKAISDYLKDK